MSANGDSSQNNTGRSDSAEKLIERVRYIQQRKSTKIGGLFWNLEKAIPGGIFGVSLLIAILLLSGSYFFGGAFYMARVFAYGFLLFCLKAFLTAFVPGPPRKQTVFEMYAFLICVTGAVLGVIGHLAGWF